MRKFLLAIVALGIVAPAALGVTTSSVSFQNGVNGYAGTFDRKISERFATGTFEIDGSTVQNYFLDGFSTGGTVSPDEQGLIRFDNIIGSGAGQIPSGAFIMNAQLQLSTSGVGSAQTNGPWGVAGLLAPFTSTASYADYASSVPGGRGAWWEDGHATRAAGSFGGQLANTTASATIHPLVQGWANGGPNNGLVVQSGFTGTSDGWSISTTGNNTPTMRPKLSVTYTTDPVQLHTFQHGVNDYTDDAMIWLQGGVNQTGIDPQLDDVTTDGTTLTQAFLDGPNGTDSPDDLTLIKFGNVFGSGAGQAPQNAPVAKAWVVVTTGNSSANARSPGSWSMHAMQKDWNTTQLYSEFGATPGLQAADGDIAETALETKVGMISGSEVWFDVTSQLEAIRGGAPNLGFAILPFTSDGWQIHFNGTDVESARPRLIVASEMTSPGTPLLGDFNGDHAVDAADYVVWRKNLGTDFNLGGNGDETGASAGVVDAADYAMWTANFGNTSTGAGAVAAAASTVPEPSALILLLSAVVSGWLPMGRRPAREGRKEEEFPPRLR